METSMRFLYQDKELEEKRFKQRI